MSDTPINASHPDHERVCLAAFVSTGDEHAFTRLVESNAQWLFAAAYRQLRNRDLAEEAVQVVFILLARRASTIKNHDRIAGWLFRALQYTVNNLRRSERARRRREQTVAKKELPERSTAMDTRHEAAETLDAAVARLPEKYRAAILLRFYRDMSFDHVAHSLGTTEAGARKRVDRALAMLRHKMGDGITAAAVIACAAHGAALVPANLAHTTAHIALTAKAGGALPVAVAGTTKGVIVMMMATKLKIAVAVAFILLVIPAAIVTTRLAMHAAPAPEPTAAASIPAGHPLFTLSKETTGITTPLHPDGTPDYVAAINEHYSRGVTPENNAFTAWLNATGAGPQILSQKSRDQILVMCGAKPLDRAAMPDYGDVLRKQGINARRRLWTEQDFPELAKYLNDNYKFLDIMAATWGRPRYWMPYVASDGRSMASVLLPSFGRMGNVANALAARATQRATHGDIDGFLLDIMTIKHMARHLSCEPTIIECMNARAISEVADQALGTIAASGKLSAAQCTTITKALDRISPLAPIWEARDIGERWNELDTVMVLASGKAEQLPLFTADENFAILLTIDRNAVDWNLVLKAVNQTVDVTVAAMKTPSFADEQTAQRVIERHRAQPRQTPRLNLANDKGETREEYSKKVLKEILITLVPGPDRSTELWHAALMQDKMVHALFAVAAFRAQTGHWPATLNELIPSYLREIPVDIYSLGGTDAVQYIVNDNGPTIYSVGPNQMDDGGVKDVKTQKDDIAIGTAAQ